MLATLALALASPAQAAYPGDNGKIAFSLAQSGIGVVNPDGSGFERLTSDADLAPAWSPDGTRIAFYRVRGIFTSHSTSALFVMDADGSNVQQLTAFSADPEHEVAVHTVFPTWSPDGTQIAFSREARGGALSYLVVMSADGGEETWLREGSAPRWSPDGSTFAFQFAKDLPHDDPDALNQGLWLSTSGGGFAHRIYNGNVFDADWSPDGGRILFTDRTPGGPVIHSIAADGSDDETLPVSSSSAAWSPDGQLVVYSVAREDGGGLVIENRQSGATYEIRPRNGALPTFPDWQPLPRTKPPVPDPGPQPGPPEPPAGNHRPACSSVHRSPGGFPRPANGKLRPVTFRGGRDPDGDPVSFKFTWIAQDEPTGLRPDAVLTADPRTVLLRNERSRRGDGRVYYVEFSLTDKWGARCVGARGVRVRRFKRRAAITSPLQVPSLG